MDQFLSMTCAVSDGDLPLNILWTFNNQPITPDMDVSISKLGKRTSVLTIDSVSGHHAGNYTCHGKNSAGSTSYATELKVIGAFKSMTVVLIVFFLFFGHKALPKPVIHILSIYVYFKLSSFY